MRQKQQEEAADQVIVKVIPSPEELLGKRSELEDVQALNGQNNSNQANEAISAEQIFANELAKESAKNSDREMFDFEFVFNQSDNYKQSYYNRKFNSNKQDYEGLITQVKKSYIAGILWNYSYYYRFCASWNWFYPFYYAPLISDLCNFSTLKFDFPNGAPLRPFEQLMAVLPPYSSHALPTCIRPLMELESSNIADFYPIDFHVDLAGKRFAWLGEVILPFIDDFRLKTAFSSIEDKLTTEEKFRNALGKSLLFFVNNKTKLIGQIDKIKLEEAFSLKNWLEEFAGDEATVHAYHYEPPAYVPHKSKLLDGFKVNKSEFYYTVF